MERWIYTPMEGDKPGILEAKGIMETIKEA